VTTTVTAWPPAPPRREDLSEEDREHYDRVADRQRRLWGMEPSGYFGALLNAPRVGAAVSDLGAVMRTTALHGRLPNDVRETADMVLSVDLDDPLVFQVHLPDAVANGVRPEFVAALVAGDDAAFTPAERQLVDYIRAVLSGRVTAEQFGALAERLTLQGAVEYTALITFLISTIRCMQALGATAEAGEVDKAALVQPFLDGTAALPDPAAHLG
jgi:hypothetical protein